MPFGRRQRDDRQIRPHAIDAIDQMDFHAAPLELQQLLAEVGRIVPLPRAEIGDQVEDAMLPVVVAEQLGDRLQRRQRARRPFASP